MVGTSNAQRFALPRLSARIQEMLRDRLNDLAWFCHQRPRRAGIPCSPIFYQSQCQENELDQTIPNWQDTWFR